MKKEEEGREGQTYCQINDLKYAVDKQCYVLSSIWNRKKTFIL